MDAGRDDDVDDGEAEENENNNVMDINHDWKWGCSLKLNVPNRRKWYVY